MKKKISIPVKQEVLSLINDISFSCVPAWYGATMQNLKMSILCPKVRENHPPCPLIIWICGGAFRQVERAVWVPEMMYFARRGYVVASVEYRTSNRAMFPGALNDVKSAIRYLKAHAREFCIDKEKIVIMGESAGGTLASLAGVTGSYKEFDVGDNLEYDSKVNAVVDFYGLMDLMQVELGEKGNFTHDVPPFVVKDWLGLDYTEEEGKRAGAINYVDENTPPFLILHGNGDVCVDLKQSEMMYETLQSKGVESEFYILENAGHGDDAFYQEETKQIVLDFIERVL